MIAALRYILLIFLLLAGTAHATQKDDLEKLRKRIAALQREFEKTSESRSEITDSLRESERAISNSNRKLHELSQQQQAASRELALLQQRAAVKEKEIGEHQAMLGRLLYQEYLDGGEQAYLKLLLNNNPNEVAREFRYFEYVARDRAATLESLRIGLAQLQVVTDQVNQKRKEMSAFRTEEQNQRQRLEQDKRTRQQVLNKIALQLKQQRREIDRLQRNENRLSQLVEKLAHVLPNALPDSVSFRSLKGKLMLPVQGRIRNRFGARRPESTMTWTGWFLRAAANQPVRAVAAGQVVYADWLRGFGNLLIIDHGQGYMSLYGNNETLYKQVGDILHAGDVVAAVGSSGGNADSGLYFELRFEGKPFDPGKWVRH